MTIVERMFATMEQKGIKSTKLAEMLGVNKSVISTWKKRNTGPPVEYVVQICELLGVDCNYLLTGDDISKNLDSVITGGSLFLKESEVELVKNFRKLDTRGQHKLHTVIYEELDRVAALNAVSAASTASPEQEVTMPVDCLVDEYGDPLVPWAASGWADITPENAEKFQKKLQAFERESRAQKERAAAKDAAVLEKLRKGILKKEK